jgi:hypothetical protein
MAFNPPERHGIASVILATRETAELGFRGKAALAPLNPELIAGAWFLNAGNKSLRNAVSGVRRNCESGSLQS